MGVLLSDPRRHKLRAIVMVVAIAASVALSVIMSSLSIGLSSSTRSSLDRIGADVYVVPRDLSPLLMDLQRFDQGHSVLRELLSSPYPPEKYAPRLSDTLFMRIGSHGPVEVLATGVDPSSEVLFGQYRTVEGRWFTNPNDEVLKLHIAAEEVGVENFSGEVLVSERMAMERGLRPGDAIYLLPSVGSGTNVLCSIVGTFVNELSRLDRSILVKLGELQYWRGGLGRDSMTEILLSYDNLDDQGAAIVWAGSDQFLFRDIVELTPKASILAEVREFTTIVDAFSTIVVVSTALVCLFFTTTLFSIFARRQARVLATVRALGMPLSRTVIMVIKESISYFVVGAFVGTLASYFIVRGLNLLLIERLGLLPSSFHLFVLDPTIIMGTMAGAFVLGVLSGLVPVVISSFKPAHIVLQEASD